MSELPELIRASSASLLPPVPRRRWGLLGLLALGALVLCVAGAAWRYHNGPPPAQAVPVVLPR